MTAHDHAERVPGCYRCELNADELGMTAGSPDLDRLDALARAATEGPWVLAGRCSVEQVHDCGAGHDCRGIADTASMCHPSQNDRYRDQERADAEFIAATDPTTVLALIAELRQARADRDSARVKVAAVQALVDHPPFWGEIHVDDLRAALADADGGTTA